MDIDPAALRAKASEIRATASTANSAQSRLELWDIAAKFDRLAERCERRSGAGHDPPQST
jgi:hypothetical protein